MLPGTTRKHFFDLLDKKHEFLYNPYLIAMGSVAWDMVNPEMVMIGTRDGDRTVHPLRGEPGRPKFTRGPDGRKWNGLDLHRRCLDSRKLVEANGKRRDVIPRLRRERG